MSPAGKDMAHEHRLFCRCLQGFRSAHWSKSEIPDAIIGWELPRLLRACSRVLATGVDEFDTKYDIRLSQADSLRLSLLAVTGWALISINASIPGLCSK